MNRLPRRFVILVVVTLVAVAAMLAWGGARWAMGSATRAADITADQTARVHNGLLASELQKFRLLPLVLAEYPDVAAVLGNAGPAAERRLDAQLEQLAARTDAAAIYLIDAKGMTRVASNWRLPTSFVGQDYGFRPYFRDAMRRGASELFALGTVSGRPGLYLARRIDQGGRALGVVVVKVEFDRVEQDWARGQGITFVTDPHGVILVTSMPGWRFGATAPLDAATLNDARRSLQFGNDPPRRLPIELGAVEAKVIKGGRPERYRVASVPASLEGATLFHLAPLEPPLAAARNEALAWALVAALLLLGLGAAFFRQTEKQRLLRESREVLEEEVVRRTAELSDANARLIVESRQREETAARFQQAREELARANRLGTLGQITAGVAHEINQPVAAIRTFAENGAALIDRGQSDAVRSNLSTIVSLTERIGTITAELRSFTRRKTPSPVPAQLGSVLDGAMLLMGEEARGVIAVEASAAQRERILVGDRVRIEQVLINLLRNALDAVEGMPARAVRVAVAEAGDRLEITVRDNGPGVDPAIRDRLFDPFESAKPGGLGLGLAIARDIAREFDGDLTLEDGDEGATFRLTLRVAQ